MSKEPSPERVRDEARIYERLATLIPRDAIPDWMDTPNAAFDGLKPIEVIDRGELDRLWKMIFFLESGVAS